MLTTRSAPSAEELARLGSLFGTISPRGPQPPSRKPAQGTTEFPALNTNRQTSVTDGYGTVDIVTMRPNARAAAVP